MSVSLSTRGFGERKEEALGREGPRRESHPHLPPAPSCVRPHGQLHTAALAVCSPRSPPPLLLLLSLLCAPAAQCHFRIRPQSHTRRRTHSHSYPRSLAWPTTTDVSIHLYISTPRHTTTTTPTMFDVRSSQPDSPVDTSMLPPVYTHASDATMDSWLRLMGSIKPTTTLPALSTKVATPKTLPSLVEARAHAKTTPRNAAGHCVAYDCELEPFEYRPGFDSVDKTRSLSSVFSDQDLVDAIMGSLDVESLMTPRAKPLTPLPLPIPTTTMTTTAIATAPSVPKMSIAIPTSAIKLPLMRKPGTFLNKDGRWIKGKPCRMDNCDKRAQSNGLCKGHGGGARCNFNGCAKSSQGGGFCRAHGGGKRCLFDGCEKGTQRNGYCYLHGGVRSCTIDGCDKKDRGNGKCFSHGGGRKCQAPLCATTIRRGVFCDAHNSRLAAKKL